MKMTSIAILGAALTACACHRAETETGAVPRRHVLSRTETVRDPGRFDVTAGRQMAALRWNRPGEWKPIRLQGRDPRLSVALVARDRYGDRLLSAKANAGYDLQIITVDCEHHGLAYREARSADRDDRPVDPAAHGMKPVPVRSDPAEFSRLCAGEPTVIKGTPVQAMVRLRQADRKAVAPPAKLGDADRERMWREYQAAHPAK